MNITLLLVSVLVIILASFSGKLITLFFGEKFLEGNIIYFRTFAVGVFIMLVINNVQEGIHELGLLDAILVFLLGFLGITLIERLLPEVHHHHSSRDTDHTHTHSSAWKILVSDSLHNIVDGVVLAASFLSGNAIGIGMTISIFTHEAIQEIGEYFTLRSAGFSQKKAIIANGLVSLTVIIGALLGIFVLEQVEWLTFWILPLVSGSYLSIVWNDLLPTKQEWQKLVTTKKVPLLILCGTLGLGLMIGIGFAFPHSHEHEHGDVHTEHHDEEHDEALHVNEEFDHQVAHDHHE
jgi:zinc and cadmium transporter